MRSSKKRSRSNQNRPRTLGNIINRVFDSSGPEGKVRGTPQQIIEKYQTLARDAQLSNDRVAAENFLQHAEHYTRMLAEAQREQAAEQEARQQQYQQNGGHNGNPNGGQGGNREYRERDYRDRDDRRDRDYRDPGQEDQPMVVEVIDFDQPVQDAGLVETPEARPRDDRFKGQRRDRDQQRDGNRDGNREGGAPREGNRDRRDRRDRDAPRDTDSPKREPAVAAAEPALPSFITGATEAPVVEAPVVEAPVAEAPAAEKPRRAPRKAKAPADGKPEAAE